MEDSLEPRNQKELFYSLWKQYNELDLRATGRTTRIVDNTIQELFNNPDKWTFVKDHYPTRKATQRVVDLIKRRLQYEHHMDVEIKPTEFGYELKLKNYKKPNNENEKLMIMDEIIKLIYNS